MNLNELGDEVIATRFREAQRPQVYRWLHRRYRQVWTFRNDWRFLFREDLAVSAIAGLRILVGLEGTVGFVLGLRNEEGGELEPLDGERFADLYVNDTTVGEPRHYTVADGTILVGPTPQSTETFDVTYKLRLSHLDSTGTSIQAGLMDSDTDQPLWDSTWHDVLVPGAIATGLKERNDPTWPSLEEEFNAQLVEMWQELRVDRGGRRLAYQPDDRSY